MILYALIAIAGVVAFLLARGGQKFVTIFVLGVAAWLLAVHAYFDHVHV